MATGDVFWSGSTPQPTAGELPAAYVAIRVAGGASDGSQDTFKQLPVSALSGDIGASAWTAVYAAVQDGSRTVLQVTDWFGGSGTKPAVGQYLGASGFVTDITQATTIGSAGGSSSGTADYGAWG